MCLLAYMSFLVLFKFSRVSNRIWLVARLCLLNVCSSVEHKFYLPMFGSSFKFARVSSTIWFCRVSVLAKRSLVCRALFGFAVCRLLRNVRSCVEHYLVLPCVGYC